MERRLLAMDWRDALFVHWPVDAGTLERHLPAGLRPRTRDGTAWLGIVAFVMEDIRPRGWPRALAPSFGEANLRTYVTGPDGGAGIYFFNLDAGDRLSVWVARSLYRLPYYRARMRIERTGPVPDIDAPTRGRRTVGFLSNRTHPGVDAAHLDVTYGPLGEPVRAETDSLAAFLVENYAFYLARTDLDDDPADGEGPIYRGDVDHRPWPLYEADLDLRSTNFLDVNGFDRPDEDPLAHYSPGVRVFADRIRRVQ